MASSLYRIAGVVLRSYTVNSRNIFPRRHTWMRYNVSGISTQQVSQGELNVKRSTVQEDAESLESIIEKLRRNNMSVFEAVNIFNTIQTQLTKSDLVKLENDNRFKNLCDKIGKDCPSFSQNMLISCTKSVLGMGLSPQTYVVKSLETEILWRLRKLNQRQLANLLSIHVNHQNDDLQIKVVNEIIQAIQRRWVEIENARDVCSLLQLKEHFSNDFIQKLEDRAIETMEKSSVEEMTTLFSLLANIKLRPPSVLRSLAYHLSRQMQKLTPKQISNLMFAMSSLNFPDQVLLQRLTTDLILELSSVKKSTTIASVLTAIGRLRWKHFELMDGLSEWILKNVDNCRPEDLVAYTITTAKLNYKPHQKEELFKCILNRLTEKSINLPNVWLDVVWSFVVHGVANETHFESVLKSSFREKLTNVNSKLKLVYIDSAVKFEDPKYKGPFLSKEFIKATKVPQSKEMQRLSGTVTEALNNFIPKGKFMLTNTIIGDCIFVDAEFLVDSKAKPLPLQNSDKGLPTGANKVALIVHHFKDYTIHVSDLTGDNVLIRRILQKMNFAVVDIPYLDFSMQNTTLQKVQYLQRKISEEIVKLPNKDNL